LFVLLTISKENISQEGEVKENQRSRALFKNPTPGKGEQTKLSLGEYSSS
jgi:hypothetical protein